MSAWRTCPGGCGGFPGAGRVLLYALAVPLALLCGAGVGSQEPDETPVFVRGDANSDGRLTLADVFAILRYLHRGGSLSCLDAADTDDSGFLGTTDFVYILRTLFLRESPPPLPFPSAGVDPTPDELGCEARRPDGGGAQVGALATGGFCEDPPENGGGAGAEFILFKLPDVRVFPGQEDVRVPILLSTAWGNIQGVTLSLRNDPPILAMEEIDFSGGLLEKLETGTSWSYSYDGQRDEGYLSSTFALDLAAGKTSVDQVWNAAIAQLVFSVPDDLTPGTEAEVRFEEVPGRNGLPPIPNELVREVEPVRRMAYCGMRIRIVAREEAFLRGDANRNWRVEISDVIEVLRFLFDRDVRRLPCADAADVDDSGKIELTDPVILMKYLFSGGSPPYPPFLFASTDFRNDGDPLRCAEVDD